MNFFDLLLLSIGLAMDAFAVSICKGLSIQTLKLRHPLTVGLWFGGFQVLMPLLGWLLGSRFATMVDNIDHWVAFILLAFIGGHMVKESREAGEEADPSLGFRVMLPLAVATSIDALAIGVTFSFLDVNLWVALTTVGVTSFLISGLGMVVGHKFGTKYKSGAELLGGVVLILIGTRLLLDGLGVFG